MNEAHTVQTIVKFRKL